jgi:hypothetical protein
MAAVITQLANAVTALLNAGVAANAFATAFTAERVVVIDLKATDLQTVKVKVVGTREETEQAARDLDQDALRIEVGVLKKADPNNLTTSVDGLIELVEQIRTYLRNHSIDGYENTTVVIEPLYDHNRLLTKGLFASVLVCTYTVDRDRLNVEVEDE